MIFPPPLGEVPEEKLFDARQISCADKHRLIFGRWAETPVGDYFVLINDHRPTPLYQQFERSFGGVFEWIEIVALPTLFAVRIERLGPDPAGHDPHNTPTGCGSSEDSAPVLAWIEIDARRASAEEARSRILRLARTMPAWAGLVADTAEEIPDLIPQLRLLRMPATSEPKGAGCRYSVRVGSRDAGSGAGE